ncbi:MAG: hypothetical protein K9J30_06960 [Bacteroidales bacterium]|nr:hypothetical protein [Bacteroidales bacterium]
MKRSIIILLVCLPFALSGQRTGFSVTGGVGTYELSELKNYHNELLERLPVDINAGNYFPPYSNFRLSLFREMANGVRYGLVYGYSTSGAHANYKDYSGYLNLDQTVTAYQLGISGSYNLLKSYFFNFYVYGDLRLGYIRDDVNLNILTSYYFDNSSLLLHAFSPMGELGFEVLFNLKKLSIGGEVGYLYDTGFKFNTGNANELEATIDLGPSEAIHSGMSGFRAGIKAILWLTPMDVE